jgi:hypothetical protein
MATLTKREFERDDNQDRGRLQASAPVRVNRPIALKPKCHFTQRHDVTESAKSPRTRFYTAVTRQRLNYPALLRSPSRLAEETRTHAVVNGKLGSAHDVIGDSRGICRDHGHGHGTSLVGFRSLILKDLS